MKDKDLDITEEDLFVILQELKKHSSKKNALIQVIIEKLEDYFNGK